MPPAISDDETSNPDGGPSETVSSTRKAGTLYKEPDENEFEDNDDDEEEEENASITDTKHENGADEKEEDEDEDEDMDEDEFVVEKIFSHYIAADGKPRFEVKWEGYEKKSDRTWEDEDNLKENASEVLQEYFKSIGGREKIFEEVNEALTKRKRKGPSATPSETNKRTKKSNGHPLDSTPPRSAKAVKWTPPSGSWEDEVETADMCQDEESGNLIVYLTWKNGNKTQHAKEVAYRRCPQKMLRFYEQHIRISREGGEAVAVGVTTQLEGRSAR